jgi:hypothetical protein
MTSLFNSSTTYDPILFFLNAEDDEERDELTHKWTENKLAELNFIGIVVSQAPGQILFNQLRTLALPYQPCLDSQSC